MNCDGFIAPAFKLSVAIFTTESIGIHALRLEIKIKFLIRFWPKAIIIGTELRIGA